MNIDLSVFLCIIISKITVPERTYDGLDYFLFYVCSSVGHVLIHDRSCLCYYHTYDGKDVPSWEMASRHSLYVARARRIFFPALRCLMSY